MIFDKIRQWKEERKFEAWKKRYEPLLMPAFLLGGFLLDVFTYKTLQVETTFEILGAYAALTALCILFLHMREQRGRLHAAAEFFVQFAFGALLSQSLLFYWFSGSASVSWPVLAVVAGLMVSNEAFRAHLQRPFAQVTIFAFVLFSYGSLLFPFLLNSLDPLVYFVGGVASTAVSLFLVIILTSLEKLRARRKLFFSSVLAVFVAMNALYFGNFIPPIPLSIREAGIYNNVRRVGNEYELKGSDNSFLGRLLPWQTINGDEDGRIFAYVAVHAPADLNTVIYHRWERYDTAKKAWVTTDRFSYAVSGGREPGYRGYSYKSRVTPGKWRVTVETERGQVLGRLPFTFKP